MALFRKSKHSKRASQRIEQARASRSAARAAEIDGPAPDSAEAMVALRRRRIIIGVAASLLVIAVGIAGYFLFAYQQVKTELAAPPAEQKVITEALSAPPVAPEEPLYVLILGNDRRGKSWARSDTIIVARFDPVTKSVSMLSLPRDSRVNVPGRGMTKLNHASAWGGPALMIKTVTNLTGLPIHHYIQVDFEGFASIVDALGGVEMKVDRAARSPEGVYVPAGEQVLNGKQALAFVRNRKGYADGDFARMRNQQAFLLALAKQASKSSNFTRAPKIISSTSKNIQTDMEVSQLAKLASTYRGIKKSDMRTASAPGRAGRVGGVSYVLLDGEKFRAVVADLKDGGFEPKSDKN